MLHQISFSSPCVAFRVYPTIFQSLFLQTQLHIFHEDLLVGPKPCILVYIRTSMFISLKGFLLPWSCPTCILETCRRRTGMVCSFTPPCWSIPIFHLCPESSCVRTEKRLGERDWSPSTCLELFLLSFPADAFCGMGSHWAHLCIL